MAISKTKSGRYSVRVQFHGNRVRGGFYDSMKDAEAAEKRLTNKLKALEKINLDNLGSYEPKLIHTKRVIDVPKWFMKFKRKQA